MRLYVTDANLRAGSLRAFDAVAPLVRSASGEWTAELRYVDSSNPPAANPVLEITLDAGGRPQTVRLSVTELHQ